METLDAYFRAFGYVPAAAKQVFVHPNTFRYRLRRLTEISGLDLDNPLERLVAELQLRIFDADSNAPSVPEDGPTNGSRTRGRQTRSRQFGGPHKVAAPDGER